MKKKFICLVVGLAVVLALAVLSGCAATTSKTGGQDAYASADLKLGGQLYDKWYKVRGLETAGNHPLYPATSKKKGGNTFRCKECHGWDYIGKDGRYSKGSHYTGIKGLFDSRGKSPKELYAAMTDTGAKHNFGKHLTDNRDIWALVKFVKEGQIDISEALNSDGTGRGSTTRGKPLFVKACGSCHGQDGNRIDFKGKKDGIQGVGWIANDNPQETFHKIRWGHPGTDMPSAVVDRGYSDQQTIDVLTYSLSLK